ncbi:hypothetical protein ALC62_12398, partial [Cyphomyrmex costatus]
SKVCMPSLPSVMHNILNVASNTSILFEKIAHLVIYGTCKDASYNSVAIFGTAPTFLQSINQNLAETVVVNDTLSFIKVNGVDPVTSSHCDSLVPPKN